jgi:hypothetical protein
VLSGVKDTRRPQLFGRADPKDGIMKAGDNIIFNFSENIECNYLQATTNFEVKGETNEAAIQEAPALQFGGKGYAESEARRNFADKNVTVEVMIKPDDVDEDMPIFSHGSDGNRLELWLTKKKTLKAVIDGMEKDFCLTHIDAVPDNFLFYDDGNGENLQLTDWEYAGMEDPHVDIAMFAIYAMYDRECVDRLIDIYFEGGCDRAVRAKIYCYVAACGLLWSNWCEYKHNLGVEFGEYSLKQYRYAKDYCRYAKELIAELN